MTKTAPVTNQQPYLAFDDFKQSESAIKYRESPHRPEEKADKNISLSSNKSSSCSIM